jgi:predicted RNA-binding protein with PIN domain
MPYLIDGHNLIGALPGIELDDPQDEAKLVGLLRAFCSRQRAQATVYFDRGVAGQTDALSGAGVTVRFVRLPASADSAIARHLERLGRAASNWVVVSSDASVAQTARRAGARPMASSDFARRLRESAARPPSPEKPESETSTEEIEAWEAAFQARNRRPPDAG